MSHKTTPTPIRIKSVSFRSCVSIGKFQTVHVEASADVPPSVSPRAALDTVKSFVAAELRRAKEGEPVRTTGRFSVNPEPRDPTW